MALFVAAAASGQTPPKYDGASVECGKTTFVGACGFCHGSNAKGGEKGPDLLRSVLVLDDVDGTAIAPLIIKGRPAKGVEASVGRMWSSCLARAGNLKAIAPKYAEPVTLQGKFLQPPFTWTEGTPPHPVMAISVTVTLPSGQSFTRSEEHTS